MADYDSIFLRREFNLFFNHEWIRNYYFFIFFRQLSIVWLLIIVGWDYFRLSCTSADMYSHSLWFCVFLWNCMEIPVLHFPENGALLPPWVEMYSNSYGILILHTCGKVHFRILDPLYHFILRFKWYKYHFLYNVFYHAFSQI